MRKSKRMLRRARLGLGPSSIAVLVGAAILGTAGQAGGAWSLVPSPNSPGRRSVLNAVAVVAPDDVWAVGVGTPPDSGTLQTLTEHWDGVSWTVVPSPNRLGRDARNALTGVTAIASNDVWAVGYSTDLDSPTVYSTLTIHWDGDNWSIVASPNLEPAPNAYNALLGVSAVATDDIWAVGGAPVADAGRAIFMHWDGAAWSLFPAPLEMRFWPNSSRFSVLAIASDNAWSVGAGESAHWDGVSWTVVPGAQDDWTIAAANPTAVWAVGAFSTYDEGQYFGPFTKAARWDGSQWFNTRSLSPRWDDTFVGVTVISPEDVWAVGRTGLSTLTEHWDGAVWSVVPSPDANPNPQPRRRDQNQLLAAAQVSSDDVWAVGYFYESDGFTQRTLILHWEGLATGP